jgi:hypothetical protein
LRTRCHKCGGSLQVDRLRSAFDETADRKNLSLSIILSNKISANFEPGGTTYTVPSMPPGKLQCVETQPNSYQVKHLSIHRKFVANTTDGTPKRSMLLEKEAFPRPLKFESGRITVDGVLLPDPELWHTLYQGPPPEKFDGEVAAQSIDDFIGRKRSR